MHRLACLALLCALSTGPALSNTGAANQGDLARGPILAAQEKGNQFAQVGRCKDYGKAQKCRATWDRRSGTCTCAGT
jgi:hypothetical protein